MRLSHFEIVSIKDIFNSIFSGGRVYLFGSRVDDSKRGGDIDLYFELDKQLNIRDEISKLKQFRLKLYEKIGEQKIDIVVSKDKNRSIEKEILKTGVLL